ncbi:MAG: peroxidase [Phycisphaerae bacterium]|nr:peroxidase [Phycisphaerae bacterium]HAW95274.1 peroxidase [Phycisphaerales bacterium]|tara:strand:+ start:624 stop:1154 length:531 start_codon:yes stop_codon:yes gene_type:complete
MARLDAVDPSTDTGPGADLLNGPLKEMQINIFKGLASHPDVLQAFLGWSDGMKGGALTPLEHEILALHISESNGCEYCTAAHTMIGEGVGLDSEMSLEARRGRAVDARHQALIDFASAVMATRGFVTNEHLDAFREAGYDDKAVIEVIAAISAHTFTNLYNHVHDTDVDFPIPPKA